MPLNKPALQSGIYNDLKNEWLNLKNNTDEDLSPDAVIDAWATYFSTKLADRIDTFVRSGLVVTTGTATNHTGYIT